MPIVKPAIIALVILSSAACTQGDRAAALQGAGIGGVLGGVSAAVRGGAITTGAVVGAATGAAVAVVSRPLLRILP